MVHSGLMSPSSKYPADLLLSFFFFPPLQQKISGLTVPEDVSFICVLFLAVLEEESPL